MGRTNGKLIPFLKDALENESFCNLKWMDKMSGTFCLKMPRFEKKKNLFAYEDVLFKWYLMNERESAYPGYSKAKAVIKAALKKSVYLVTCQSNNNELRFRFATSEEKKEKQRKQKEQINLIHEDLFPSSPILHSPNPPLSDSSGYHSGNDDFEEDMLINQEPIHQESFPIENSEFLDNVNMNDILMNPEKFMDLDLDKLNDLIHYTEDTDFQNFDLYIGTESFALEVKKKNMLKEEKNENIMLEEKKNENIMLEEEKNENIMLEVERSENIMFEEKRKYIAFEERKKENIVLEEKNRKSIALDEINLEDKGKLTHLENIRLNGAELMVQSHKVQNFEKPVVELSATVVNSSQVLDTYWLCTQKVHVDSILLLICEKQVIQDENQGISPGDVSFNNVLEPGVVYNIQKQFELNGKYFLFMLPNN